MAASAWVQAEAPHLSPVLDRAYRFVTEDVRSVGGVPHRFTAERHVVFRRDDRGLIAEVTLDRLTTDAPTEIGRRFLTGSGGIKGRTVHFRLAADGSVTSVDDQEAVWAAMLAGIAGMATKVPHPDARSPLSRDPAGAMAGLPPERQRAVIVSIVAGLWVDPASLPPPGRRAVRVAGRTLPGEPVVLDGEETADNLPDGLTRLVTRAANPQLSLLRTRIVDRTSGLLVSDEESTSFLDGDHVLGTRFSKRIFALVS